MLGHKSFSDEVWNKHRVSSDTCGERLQAVVLTAGCGCRSPCVTCGLWVPFSATVACGEKQVRSPGCQAPLAGSGCASAAWELPTRWHQHSLVTAQLVGVVRCGCAQVQLYPKTCSCGDGDFQWAAILRAFFVFISLQQEKKSQRCNWGVTWSLGADCCLHSFFLFFFQGPLKKDRIAKEETA